MLEEFLDQFLQLANLAIFTRVIFLLALILVEKKLALRTWR